MATQGKAHASSCGLSRLLELVRLTKRYSICEREPGQFEVIDDRYLLDRLLSLPELRPTTNDLVQIIFDEALEELSSGPALSKSDMGVLAWLTTTVEILDPHAENTAVNAAYDHAVIFRGSFDQVQYFMVAVLSHRVQP
jgi:hypothetical protein